MKIKGWSISSARKGWELRLFSLEKRRLRGILPMYRNTWRDSAKRTEPGSFQWCPLTGQAAKGTNWNTGGSLWTRKHFVSWQWWSTAIGCPRTLWCIYPWRYSEAVWTSSCAAGCKWPCLSSGVGPDDLQRSLLTSTNLYFCNRQNISVSSALF